MNGASMALLAAALLTFPAPPTAQTGLARLRSRVRSPPARPRRRAPPPGELAGVWDLLAASLRAGQPIPTTIQLVTCDLAGPEADALRAAAGMLALGADPADAWKPATECPGTAEFARAARRTARSGSALASVADDIAKRLRSAVEDDAEARAQRAAVLIAGPLALCFLPAFLCLGVMPVVLGLAGQVTSLF